jgi:hypothetical protein
VRETQHTAIWPKPRGGPKLVPDQVVLAFIARVFPAIDTAKVIVLQQLDAALEFLDDVLVLINGVERLGQPIDEGGWEAREEFCDADALELEPVVDDVEGGHLLFMNWLKRCSEATPCANCARSSSGQPPANIS